MGQFKWIVLLILFETFLVQAKKYRSFNENESPTSSASNDHRLLVDVDIYNRPYTLPYVYGQLERFKCSSSQCYLDLRLYRVFNTTVEAETFRLTREWVEAMKKSSNNPFKEITIIEWSSKHSEDRADRSRYVMKRCLELSVDYLAMLDSMLILVEPETILSTLMSKDKPLMAPLLRSTKSLYTSTFYLNEQNENMYVIYQQIYDRTKLGCFLINGGIKDFYFVNFQYPSVREIFLKDFVSDENRPISTIDIIARQHSIPMYVCNRENFGYIPAQYVDDSYDEDLIREYYIHMIIEHQLNGPKQNYLPPIGRSSLIEFPSSEKTKFGFDEIYVVNLERRQDRRQRLAETFETLNMKVRFFEAVDGKYTINQSYLEKHKVRLMPNYEDPYNLRPMNYGELGCFFSHYFIWQDIVKNNYVNGAIILEDDVRFDVYFRHRLEKVFANKSFEWDLVYLGRKIMRQNEEDYDNRTETYLIEPSYSHWTVGYVLSLRAAKILVEENPIEKILPVDEYLPIMFDHHPNKTWKKFFNNRILKAFAFHPSILTPSHYFGEPNYISDTENTTVLEKGTEFTPNTISLDVTETKTVDEDNSAAKDEL